MTERARRPRWRVWLVGVLIALVVLVAAGELILRVLIPSIVAQQVREQLHLSPDATVDVELGGSALLPALVGRVGPISVEVPHVAVFDDVTATLSVSADSVPFDPSSGDIDGAHGSVTIPAQSIGPVVSLVTQGVADAGEVEDGRLRVSRTLEIFGQTTTLAVGLDLGVDEGRVRIIPLSITAAGFRLSADQVSEVTGGSLDPLLVPQEVCVSDRIPSGITLTDIELGDGSVTIDADIAPRILSEPAQQQPGVCEG